MTASSFLVRARSSVAAGNADDSSETYAERIVRLNKRNLRDDPECLESDRKRRKWSVKLERERKGPP